LTAGAYTVVYTQITADNILAEAVKYGTVVLVCLAGMSEARDPPCHWLGDEGEFKA
jgi:hypothetical protein